MILCCFFFFFNDTATTEIYTLSLHDALPISLDMAHGTLSRSVTYQLPGGVRIRIDSSRFVSLTHRHLDRKSTRLNSSHANISYAVFCLKKKKKKKNKHE